MEETITTNQDKTNRAKFFMGGFLIVAAVIYLIVSSTQANAQYFMTVEELNDRMGEVMDRDLRISGAVIGESIEYDLQTLTLTFVVAHLPGDNSELAEEGGLGAALHAAVSDSTRERLTVEYIGVKPDLLKNEAQAIMTGRIGNDGVFYADELLLKCPTKYEDAVPEQAEG